MRIMSNIPALQSYNALNKTNNALSKSIERLSTGLRINSAADDAAGLAISEKMRSQIRGLTQATSNAQNGISMVQTAEGALSETHSILQRVRELSVQAANDTLTQDDRSYIQLEIDQLKEEVSRIATTTQFNKKSLLDGSAAVVWSASDLSTKAIITGGLRQVDQFGQKSALEGNYKITVNADPGKSEVKKSDIFKIKHKNVIMNLSKDSNNGFQTVEVDNLPAGDYKVTQGRYNSAQAGVQTVVVTSYTDTKNLTYDTASNFSAALADAAFAGNITLLVSGAVAAADGGGDAKIRVVANAADGVFFNGKHYTQGALVTTIQNVHVGSAGVADAADLDDILAAVSGGWGTMEDALSKITLADETPLEYKVALSGSFQFGGFYGLTEAGCGMTVLQSALGGLKNSSILLEVIAVDKGTGTVTFRAQVKEMDAKGNIQTRVDDNLIIGAGGVRQFYDNLGFTFLEAGAISISDASEYDVGDKMVLNFLSTEDGAVNDIAIDATLNSSWPDGWSYPDGSPAELEALYRLDMDSMANKLVHFNAFYLNSANGTVYEGSVKISFNDAIGNIDATGPTITAANAPQRVSFEAAYIGQVAQSDVKLRDLDKFWDSNGTFLLTDPKEIRIYQGDGTNTSITLYATDTLSDVQKKLNDAIAYGLGQSKYVVEEANKFVSFVEDAVPDTAESVPGTFIIRTLVPGNAGKLSFAGDEDLIKAFSLNVIQESVENTFRVSVADAHTGKMVATNQKISGNKLVGIVHPNVDVVFDPMANIAISWNEYTRAFDLIKAEGSYDTVLHLCDNTTVFQVGANEGDDMALDIGDMSAFALGIENIVVTDRESAARAITIVDIAIGKVSSQRAKLGAYQNRLEHTISNLTTAVTNTTAAESRIRDVDMAKEMMEFTKLNILSQAGNSMLAQANQLPQNVLSLLRG